MALSWAIAGGGTGGHVTPGLALAEVIAERGERVLFVGSERGMEARLVPAAGFELVALPSEQVMGRSVLGRLRGVLALIAQVGKARRALAEHEVDIVVSVGGYAALPAAAAAVLSRRVLTLIEPNAIPGRVNRLTARFATRVFVAFEEAAERLATSKQRVRVTGIPLRRQLVSAFAEAGARTAARSPLHLLVFGGSQGARQINEAMMDIAPRLAGRPLAIFHQAGEADRERVAEAYAAAGVAAEVVAFEQEMPKRYLWADLAIGRAGALTVAELAMAGLPALLVPYPFAADDHQGANARALADAGAAVCLASNPLDVDAFGDRLTGLIDDPEALAPMSRAASSLARPEAAHRVVEECLAALASRSATASEAGT